MDDRPPRAFATSPRRSERYGWTSRTALSSARAGWVLACRPRAGCWLVREELFAVSDCYSLTYLLAVLPLIAAILPARSGPLKRRPRERGILASCFQQPVRVASASNNQAIPYFYIQQARIHALEACTYTPHISPAPHHWSYHVPRSAQDCVPTHPGALGGPG
ncbi:hypothetical protein C8R44DRAFT_896000 [Mycena epipterygia]|nr:hypothetical protein C8R44DRAFT_896000 [Mycena epipterygia]